MEWLLVMLVPFIVGIMFGVFVQHRDWRRLALLPVVPCVSTVVVCIVLYVWDIVSRILSSQLRNTYPIYVQSFAAMLLFTPGIFLFGLLPAIVGYLLSFVFYATP